MINRRFLLVIESLILIIASAAALLYLVGLQQLVMEAVDYSMRDITSKTITGVLLALVLLMSIYSFIGSLKSSEKEGKYSQVFIKKNDLGEVSVSITALENVIVKAARSVDGVLEVKPAIKNTPEGVAVFIKTEVASGVSIPELSEKVQNDIQEQIRNFAGIEAVEIRVYVENISGEAKSKKT